MMMMIGMGVRVKVSGKSGEGWGVEENVRIELLGGGEKKSLKSEKYVSRTGSGLVEW